MPYMQMALVSLNAAGADGFAAFDAAGLVYDPAEQRLGDVLQRLVPDVDDRIVEFVNTFPSGVQAAILGCLAANAARDVRLPVTFAWAPGYDYSVQIWDVASTRDSTGGITILVTSRYPGDTHPLDSSLAAS